MLGKNDILFFPPRSMNHPYTGSLLPWQRWCHASHSGGMSCVRRSLMSRDHLVLADNLDLLNIMPDAFVDLAYIDPPFATGTRKSSPKGDDGPAGFEDTYTNPQEFVDWLAPRLVGLWRVLSQSGNLVIHLDSRAIHHVRMFCDREFGESHWENEIIWHYTGGGRSRRRFSRKHDVLLWYSKSPDRIFNIDVIREPYSPTSGYARGGIVSKKGKKYMPHPDGTPADDVWDIPMVNPMADERSGYPTQKPLKLLERVISALSDENALVCDIFSGSGTTALACRKLKRRFLCCDNNPDAVGITLNRLWDSNLYETGPEVISTGFYRLNAHPKAMHERILSRFIERELMPGESGEISPTLVTPIWRKNGTGSLPPPLSATDIIAALGSPPRTK